MMIPEPKPKPKPFKDAYGRFMRVVYCGINIYRLQDNKGRNYIIQISELGRIL